MMKQSIRGVTEFDPYRDVPSLAGKVILVTGGTTGLGFDSVKAFANHSPMHICFTGRNISAANALLAELKLSHLDLGVTFIEIELSSLQSVKDAITNNFKHDRLDILMNNAGIIVKPPSLSVDGYEIQFATNHLEHAMITRKLLPYLLKAAEEPGSDVRVVSNTSDGYEFHRIIKSGISFTDLDSGSTMNKWILGVWQRYGQSKVANILFTSELGRRYPQIMSVAIHPDIFKTPMVTEMRGFPRYFNYMYSYDGAARGVYNQLWCAAGAKKSKLRKGGFYRSIGHDAIYDLKGEAVNANLAKKLWDWTESVLDKFEEFGGSVAQSVLKMTAICFVGQGSSVIGKSRVYGV